ncbi:hypothetical protein [Lichenibacterium ramalinae]|uniref:Uncharacterized protein n=1 Tax=Lichenibacterium ramalinae TaxID=2316527 RepID=A0A4Q2RJF1_9HYPH|nr:hypothetical protein [Lichenibacterium ramalinae]RYB07101.1 hypothetical protein D3272_03235 [Lichenibacterium ramalinae]
MPTIRSAALAIVLSGLAGPALAATCNMTVLGTTVLDDVACTVASARGVTTVSVGAGGTVLVRRSVMSARLPGVMAPTRRSRSGFTNYGQVVTSSEVDDKTCFFNQTAVLCVE